MTVNNNNTMKTKLKILKVWIEHRPDPNPDTSHMGEYASKPTSRFSIRREDMERNQYRYFNPSGNYLDSADKLKGGLTPAVVAKYVQEDYRRMETLHRGDWLYIGIIAKAEVQLNGHSTVQVLRSGGLWGVESDSGDKYLTGVASEELGALRAELEAIGFSKCAITSAFALVTTKTQ